MNEVVIELKKYIERAVRSLYDLEIAANLEHPADLSHGDYSTNVAFLVAKKLAFEPGDVAKRLAMEVKEAWNNRAKDRMKRWLKSVEAVEPGFVNFYFSKAFFIYQLREIIRLEREYGSSAVGDGRVVVFDYSAPNIARPFGVGHLRSTIIGQALYNIYSFLGYQTVGDNHIGDWGTQFGKLIYAIKEWGDLNQLPSMSAEELMELYVLFHKRAEEDPQLEQEGRKWFKRLESGDVEARAIWEHCVKISLEEFQRIYDLLGVQIDYTFGESFYQDKMEPVIEQAQQLGLAEESEGALVIPTKAGPPLMLRKSDGATTYHTRDLATIKFRQERFGPVDQMVYEVGEDQTLHFKQLFEVARRFPWGRGVSYKHVAHGMMHLPSGRMSTRKGRFVLLEKVLEEAIRRAGELVEEKHPDISEEERLEIARKVGIGAIKYSDLKRHHSKDIVFDWDEVLSLEGNSGPYLQYTYTRAQSILNKAEVGDRVDTDLDESLLELQTSEMNLLRRMYQFPEIVLEAAARCAPNQVCNYLYGLCQLYNSFYQEIPVLMADGESRKFRICLTAAVAQLINNGLVLMGIETTRKM